MRILISTLGRVLVGVTVIGWMVCVGAGRARGAGQDEQQQQNEAAGNPAKTDIANDQSMDRDEILANQVEYEAHVKELEEKSTGALNDLDEIYEHMIGDRKPLRVGDIGSDIGGEFVTLRLEVDAKGNVTGAEPIDGPTDAFKAAVAYAMTWKYEPFVRDGKATAISLIDSVRLYPKELQPEKSRAFPGIKRQTDVEMSLEDNWGYGVEIWGDGRVEYRGRNGAALTGEHQEIISTEQVKEIEEAFRKADFFSLKDRYWAGECQDWSPQRAVRIRIDTLSKEISDCEGKRAGMPDAVADLEDTIEKEVGVEKWTKGNEETVAALKAEGWDFRSAEGGQLLIYEAQRGFTKGVKDLLDADVNRDEISPRYGSVLEAAVEGENDETLEAVIQAGVAAQNASLKAQALLHAAARGNTKATRMLMDYGANANITGAFRSAEPTVLMLGAVSGSPELVETILAAHVDVNAVDEKGWTALMYACGSNVDFGPTHLIDRVGTAQMLIAAGAEIGATDEDGNTVLHIVEDEDVARMLIRDGADVEARNSTGDTPLMVNPHVEVVRALVEAGADVEARNNEGKNALDQAVNNEEKMAYLRGLGLRD